MTLRASLAPAFSAGVLCAVALVACNTTSPSPVPAPPAPAAAPAPATRQSFGAPLGKSAAAQLGDVLKAPDKFADQTVLVEGEVRRACTRKGCWMELSEAQDPAAPGCRVTFKDYGFFVPTDSAGAHAKVQGTLGVNTLPPERVAHLESEGGNFPRKNPDGSVDELRLVATGVELRR